MNGQVRPLEAPEADLPPAGAGGQSQAAPLGGHCFIICNMPLKGLGESPIDHLLTVRHTDLDIMQRISLLGLLGLTSDLMKAYCLVLTR